MKNCLKKLAEILPAFKDKSMMTKLDTGKNDDARYGFVRINDLRYQSCTGAFV